MFAEPSSVIIVDKDSLFRECLSAILLKSKLRVALSVAALTSSHVKLLLCDEFPLLILGASSAHAETTEQIALFKKSRESSSVAVLINDGQVRSDEIASFLAAGANACLCKSTTSEILVKTLELATQGETVVALKPLQEIIAIRKQREASQFGNAAIDSSVDRSVSAQEKRVLRFIAGGTPIGALLRSSILQRRRLRRMSKRSSEKPGCVIAPSSPFG